ncbi:MAG: hypothetical protein WBQ85_16060, partial [Candidatus Sulfotelmatobacter sp.]
PGHKAVHGIGDRDWDQDQIYVHLQGAHVSIQGRGDEALGGDLFGLTFFYLARLDVNIVHLRLPESRGRRGTDYRQREQQNQETRRGDSVQRGRSWVPGSNRAGVPSQFPN